MAKGTIAELIEAVEEVERRTALDRLRQAHLDWLEAEAVEVLITRASFQS